MNKTLARIAGTFGGVALFTYVSMGTASAAIFGWEPRESICNAFPFWC